MKIDFYVRFHTRFGQNLLLTGDIGELGNGDPQQALIMEYLDEEFWYASIDLGKKEAGREFSYKYFLRNEDGELLSEWGEDRKATGFRKSTTSLELVDTWNHAGEYENAFYTAPFRKVLLNTKHPRTKDHSDKNYTHIFRVKAPLLEKHESVCLAGSGERLEEWKKPLLLRREGDWWTISLDLSKEKFPLAYKYGICDQTKDQFRFEQGENRILNNDAAPHRVTALHDGFIHFPNNTWKGAGVAIPVFSLRSKESFGVGEFPDIKLLVDWAKKTGIRLIQLLPVNDTISTNTWQDSYPYSAISAFALHPLYMNLFRVAGKEYGDQLLSLKARQKQLNEETVVNYEEVMKYKTSVLKELYEVMGQECLGSEDYKDFFDKHSEWLQPYAAFCWLRDKYGTADFSKWDSHAVFDRDEVARLWSKKSSSFHELAFYYFVQYHLHLQLKDAADYAHRKGVVLKGDIPIGISRNSADAWVSPEMYNLCWQAGAPPDDFTAIGQNWGFPTYNWKRMQDDGFSWWKQRFEQMSDYFDAFRIDHILGFFRIWSIPANAVQGLLGRFVPCLPIHLREFSEKGIWFDEERYCKPFITDEILHAVFGELAKEVKTNYVISNGRAGYELQLEYSTQLQIQQHFDSMEESGENERLRNGLFELIANVILFREENGSGEQYHFRISMEKTHSFQNLPHQVQQKLKDLYVDYFYRRQDDFWYREAMHKLPRLKAVTRMLVCGEDLGMVPHCVPDVMQQLGILSLEIQRMPKIPGKEFFHPQEAPYLSVITPSTHDMSTLRGWWEEDRTRTRHFYNQVLNQPGEAPFHCEAWINRAIVLQHLYSPAMWSIFQLQDILGMDETLRRENPHEERINNPANPKHYWQYRMHLPLEELIKQKEFNEELKEYVKNSGR
jgi:4-alpha-glucanotransferase